MAVYEEGFAPRTQEKRASNVLNYAGAALSLALIAGVGVWGYKLVVRDVSGIPVVRAMEGDMRVLPDNPGGDVAPHTGLAVNEVAAMGEAGGPEDLLVLAPREIDLAAEDLEVQLAPAAAELLETVSVSIDGDAGVAVADDWVPVEISAADAEVLVEDAVTAVSAEVDEIALLTQMLATNPAVLPPETAAQIVPATVPGVRTSIRPIQRPATLSTVRSAPVPASATAASSSGAEVAISTTVFPAGTNLVHLGAYATPQEAADAWVRLDRRLGQYLGGYERVIQVSNQSGGTWYRLRASGFEHRAEARRLCAVLQAEYAECIAVVTQ